MKNDSTPSGKKYILKNYLKKGIFTLSICAFKQIKFQKSNTSSIWSCGTQTYSMSQSSWQCSYWVKSKCHFFLFEYGFLKVREVPWKIRNLRFWPSNFIFNPASSNSYLRSNNNAFNDRITKMNQNMCSYCLRRAFSTTANVYRRKTPIWPAKRSRRPFDERFPVSAKHVNEQKLGGSKELAEKVAIHRKLLLIALMFTLS